jgi:CDP-ribitol ribitolphosphotransferase / teichoic acid ribitol-phosphate polymerase
LQHEDLVVKVEGIDWNKSPNRIYIYGYSYIQGISINTNEKVKKSFFITNGKRKFFIPIENILRQDISEKFGYCKYNYDYSGFSGFIDLTFIDDMKPLSEGIWTIGIYINADGEEIQQLFKSEYAILEEPKIIKTKGKNNIITTINLDTSKDNISLNVDKNILRMNSIDKIKESNDLLKNIIKNIYKEVTEFIINKMYVICCKFKINEDRILFLSDSRCDLSGNFEFVYDELKKRGGYDIKVLLKPSIDSKKTLKEKLSFPYYIATSKYIFLDDFYPRIYKFNLRKEIELIQLWHACGAFKTFGFSRLGKPGGPSVRSKNHRNYTKAIVSSNNIKKHYAEAFGISEERVVATGVPRTDIFFNEEYKNNKIDEIYKKYPIIKNKKVIMFAPTFRGAGQKTAHYNFEKLNLDLLMNKLQDEYVFVMKLHPFIKNVPILGDKYKDFIIDMSSEREINDLLFISDILITDYSSVCFEYSLLKRPMIFFAYDLEEYISSRDFYYPYRSFVPGPIARTTEDVVYIIENEKFELDKLEKFRNKFFDHFDGKSTERVVNNLMR